MNVFESIGEKTDKAGDIGEKYLKTSHQYFKLKLFQQLAFTVSVVAKLLIIGSLFILAFIFGSIAAAVSLGDLFNSLALGYVTVAGVYLLIGVLVYLLRASINTYVIKKMGAKFFSEDI
ncbi:hypothetical protein ACW5R3_09835 [Bizionia sp. KMM 8389]